MKRLALWLARHCLTACGRFYRYGLGVDEVLITVEWSDLEKQWIVQERGPQVWH